MTVTMHAWTCLHWIGGGLICTYLTNGNQVDLVENGPGAHAQIMPSSWSSLSPLCLACRQAADIQEQARRCQLLEQQHRTALTTQQRCEEEAAALQRQHEEQQQQAQRQLGQMQAHFEAILAR